MHHAIITGMLNLELIYHTTHCGPPSFPPSSYIFPYTSTSDGAIMNFTCQKSYALLNEDENITVIIIAAICNKLYRKMGSQSGLLSFVQENQVLLD